MVYMLPQRLKIELYRSFGACIEGTPLVCRIVPDDQRDAEAEVFKIKASTQEVGLHAVFKEEIFDLLLHGSRAFAGIVLEALSVAYFGVPLLAGGQCLVGFNLLEHVIRHEVVGTPRNVPGVFIELNRRNFPVLFE